MSKRVGEGSLPGSLRNDDAATHAGDVPRNSPGAGGSSTEHRADHRHDVDAQQQSVRCD